MTRKQRIEEILSQALSLKLLQIEDESHKHHVPEGAETHFKILVIAEQFQSLSRVERHRLINKLLAQELKTGLHALSLDLHSPAEWESGQKPLPDSPNCRDGYRHGTSSNHIK